MFEKIRNWYRLGLWTKKRVRDAVDKGVITQEQYRGITGENY